MINLGGEIGRIPEEVVMSMRGPHYLMEKFQKHFDDGKAEGKAEGLAVAVLCALQARSVEISAEERRRIEACRDAATLERWLNNALQTGRPFDD